MSVDDGQPQTVRHHGQLVTTWREGSGRWRVHIETIRRHTAGAVNAEKLLSSGNDRLTAWEFAKDWIERHVGQNL